MALFKGNNRKRGCSLRLFHRWDLVSGAGAGGFRDGFGGAIAAPSFTGPSASAPRRCGG